jgi:hypothetical protein
MPESFTGSAGERLNGPHQIAVHYLKRPGGTGLFSKEWGNFRKKGTIN